MPKVVLNGMHALVTGSSSGIGEALALELASAGCDVSLVARRRERLEALAEKIRAKGRTAWVFPKDLAAPGAAAALAREVEEKARPVDLLVNNAGVSGGARYFVDTAPEEVRLTLEVNLAAPTELARALLPGMLARRRGALVSVSSGMAFAASPVSSVYCATKAGLAMLDEVLRLETAGSPIHILSVYPGPVDTPMLRATMGGNPIAAQLARLPKGDPAQCARKIRKCLETGQDELFYPEVFAVVRPARPILSRIARLASPWVNRARERRTKASGR